MAPPRPPLPKRRRRCLDSPSEKETPMDSSTSRLLSVSSHSQRLDRFFSVTPKANVNSGGSSNSIAQEQEEHVVVEEVQPSHATIDSAPINRQGSIRFKEGFTTLEIDPGKRGPITNFHPDDVERVRRLYLDTGPEQPSLPNYPITMISGKKRRFNSHWFHEHDYNEWLEYSESRDALFCLRCYLFKDVNHVVKFGSEAFVDQENGFKGWAHIGEGLEKHVKSESHKSSVTKCRNLLNTKQSIRTCMSRQTEQQRIDYVKDLQSSLTATKLLLRGGQAFRGKDESLTSSYQGHFLEFVKQLRMLENRSESRRMTSPIIQKELARSCAFLTTSKICEEIGDDLYSILADESGDCSMKEQMGLVVRYVDSKGGIVERFLGIEHVKETSAKSLKKAIESLLTKNKFSMSKIRGQGYDGASNMSGRENGLKTLIQKECPSAYYVHCFAHQLQLALVAGVKRNVHVDRFFNVVNRVVNNIGSSNKRHELLRDNQFTHLKEIIEEGLIETGSGLNQQSTLSRAGDTRWGSHFRTLMSLMNLYKPVIGVLETLAQDCAQDVSGPALDLSHSLQKFSFIFMLYLLTDVLGVSNDLNVALQKREQDLLNALNLVNLAKNRLQNMRDCGWESLFNRVVESCVTLHIKIPAMDGPYHMLKSTRAQVSSTTNLHHYKNDCFLSIIDVQLKELNERFNVESIELLDCVACLSPTNLFASFDEEKLLKMMRFYPYDFVGECDISMRNQLANYIMDMQLDLRFSKLKGLVDLSTTLVATNKSETYSSVYKLVKLVKLALLLPVATASVERAFSAMNHVKSDLRSKMGDEWLNDRLVTFIERDVFMTINEDDILAYFQKMNPRKTQM